jgi:hypothetical protein
MKYRINFNPVHLTMSWIDFKTLFSHIDESYLKSEWEKSNVKTKKQKKKEGV